jgi:predicted dehydrogenase
MGKYANKGAIFMNKGVDRRTFFKMGAATTAGLALTARGAAGAEKPVRIGVIGIGRRGGGLLNMLVRMKGVEIPALCDIDVKQIKRGEEMILKAGQPKPEGYSKDENSYKTMMERDDLDAVLITTPWEWHTPMAIQGMRSGKYVAVEVPAAITMDQCGDLVKTHEATGVPCMMLENWSFRRDNLAVLNMIRKGYFGEMVHCHCAHSHNCVPHFFFDLESGHLRWPGKYLVERNADLYPTHTLGPVISWMDINCGDYFDYMTSTATSSRGINAYFARKFGPDHPNTKRKYAQGDIVTTVVKTHQGKTIVINYDMQLPRPYDNRWLIQGTLGVYNEQRNALYLEGKSPKHHQWEPFGPYQEKYDHIWWKSLKDELPPNSHGGTDYIELREFLRAVRNRTQTPIDVYDSVIMSVITPLSEQSIAQGSVPVKCPDFTGGKWKTRKPSFALDV